MKKKLIFLLLAFFFSTNNAKSAIPEWLEIGVNTHGFHGNYISIIENMGAKWVRAEVPWYQIEVDQYKYDFSSTDIMLRDLKRRNVKVLFILAYAPSFWSSNGETNGVPNMQAWKNFVHQMTSRYKDLVDAWEVWNEPNLEEFWVGDARQYFELLRNAYPIIKRNDPEGVVAAPGLATLYSAKPMEFLKRLKAYGALSYLDVVSHHTYGPDARSLKRLLTETKIGKPSVLKMMKETGFDKKPFWLTEFGCDELRSGGEAMNAHCLAEQIKYLTTQQWIEKAFIYSLIDDPRYLDKFRWGLLRPNGTPKLSVMRLRQVINN